MEKTLANRNARGLGPKPEYFGTIPFYREEVLDEFVATAFTPESPVAVTRRKIAAKVEAKKHRARRKAAQKHTTIDAVATP
jgi:hypothetical protein